MNLKITSIFILASMLTVQAQTRTASGAEALFESARQKETVQGDLKGAIETYRQIVSKHGKDRAAAARAMLLMAQCHEKLGQAEAKKVYEEIARNYTDQPSAVSQARARLAALGSPVSSGGETRARLVWDKAIDYQGAVTPDGRYLTFTDWATGDLAIRDLRAGQHRRLTDKGGFEKAQGEVEGSIMSPDGKRIAFGWQRWDPASKTEGIYQMRLINADGTGERLLRQMKPAEYATSASWSPDGKWLVVAYSESGGTSGRLELLNPDSGESKVIPTSGKLPKTRPNFSPDGKWLAYSEPIRPEGQRSWRIFLIAMDGSANREMQVAEECEFVGWAPDGKSIVLAKDRGGVRGLNLLPVSGGRATGEAALLHTPSIGNAQFLSLTPRGELFYGTNNYRTDAWLVRLDPATGRWGDPLAKFPVGNVGWANNPGNLRFSPDGKQLVSMLPNRSISIRTLSTGSERLITPSLRDYRRFEWTPDGRALLAAATGESGRFGLHRVDLASGGATFVCDFKPGFVFAPSPDGKLVFHFTNRGLSSVELSTGAERVLVSRDFGSQGPQNIRLSHDGRSLVLTTFGYVGVYDIATGALRDIATRTEPVGEATVVGDWSADGLRIITIARPNIGGGPRELRIYPAAGGIPQKYGLDGVFGGLATSPDGIHAAVVKLESHQQVWALENFLPAR